MKAYRIALKSLTIILVFNLIGFDVVAQQHPYIDVAKDVGIDHTYVLLNAGGGVSFVDFDLDGLDDITLATGENEAIQFYRNNGGSFELIDLGIQNFEEVKTVLWADIDNDGDKDFYATAFAGPNHLYENKGDLEFEQITISAGLPVDTMKSFGAIWGDYNRDGFLDLYYTERPFAGTGTNIRNRLFKNLSGNQFEEVTYETNADDENRLPFCAAFFDYNDDKWPDIYIANDRNKRNTLLENNAGVYTDVSEQCNADIEMDAMNVGIADIDNNGLSDIYVTNTPAGSALLKCSVENGSDQIVFSEEAGERGIGFYGIGWGANFLDVNNDGWQDLYVSGMQIGSEVTSSALYINDQTGFFTEADKGLEGDTVTSFVNAIGDFNNDGYPDIMVNNSQEFDSQLWTAEAGDNNWIKIGLKGIRSNRDGIGVKIETYSGDLYQMRYTHCGIAFMGQNSNQHLIGLGDYTTIDSIKFTWPTGHIDMLENVAVNQTITVTEGQTTNGNIDIDSDITLLTNTVEVKSPIEIMIAPNPATEKLFLSGEDIKSGLRYTISNGFGQSYKTGILNSQEINISDLNTGYYLLQLFDNEREYGTFKFVKI